MDEGEIKRSRIGRSSDNVLRPDEGNSPSEFDDDSRKEDSEVASFEKASNILDKNISEVVTETDLDLSKVDLGDADEKADDKNLETLSSSGPNNEREINRVVLSNTLIRATIDDVKENVKTDLPLVDQSSLVQESAVSDSVSGEILIAENSEISIDNKERFISSECNETTQIQLPNNPIITEEKFEIQSDNTHVSEISPDIDNNVKLSETNSNLDEGIDKDRVRGITVPIARVCNKAGKLSISNHCDESSDNEEEQIIFNFDAQIRQETSLTRTSLENSFDNCNMQSVVGNESLNFNLPILDPSSNDLTRSKSVAELNTIRSSKPSLADDAKLVKFSVSTKSMNIMQSNAQFLNKSKNFLNFITEKSTNIMEKTLVPQNLAAKYNSILKLTENSPASYKKSTEGSGPNSESLVVDHALNLKNICADNCESANQMANNVMNSPQLTDTTDSVDKKVENKSVSDNLVVRGGFTREDQSLFLKCSVNEKKIEHNSVSTSEKSGTTSLSHLSMGIQSENNQPNGNDKIANMNDGETLSHSDCNTLKKEENLVGLTANNDSNSSSNALVAMPREDQESFRRDGCMSEIESTHDTETNEASLIKENESIRMMAICKNESSNVEISPSLKQAQYNQNCESIDNVEVQPNDCGMLDQLSYTNLLRDYRRIKEENKKLSERVMILKSDNEKLTAENNGELHALQLEMIEKTIEQLKHDLKQSNANQDMLSKEYVLANKERESMVMKYAISEKQLIDTQRAREYAERKVNEALREQEILHTKLKQVQGERTRICNILDVKCHELTDAQKEIERLKEELSMREVKLKWNQNKLKAELESQKENQQKLEKAMIRINEMKEECELVRKESHETIRKFQQSEDNKVVTLDQQLKEQQARLILERHVTEDKELSRLQLQKEVETLKQRQQVLIEENNTLSLKVQNLEKERLNYENNLSNLKVIADQRQKEIVDLVGKVSQLETIKLQLQHKEALLSSNETEVERLRQTNSELQSDMDWCREREAHMLDFTQKLTDKNVRLQSEFTSIEAKNEQLELEQASLNDKIKELNSKLKTSEINLESEKSKRTEECELLARHVAEQTQLARNLAQKLEDSQGENAVIRRKQQVSIKEMTKELQMCKKKLDAFETGSPSNSMDRTSRTGSSSSLSTGETLNGAVSDASNSGDHVLQPMEPDKQTLIDRIVKLQKIRVKQAEKLDFLEEHTKTLVNELQKKTKIIKNYILHENPDAMGSNARDRNKAELAKYGGIMASVYNQRVSDDNMTLELSLEINQKLQAVLEDTLLKNITLKDSIDTLGGEIARLTMKNNRK